MTNEEAIKHGKEQLDIFGGEHQEFIEMAIKALEQTRWIPVSERLPKDYTEVLTCNLGGFIEIQSIVHNYWQNQNGDCNNIEYVIAWMPLPQPYKAESEDNE